MPKGKVFRRKLTKLRFPRLYKKNLPASKRIRPNDKTVSVFSDYLVDFLEKKGATASSDFIKLKRGKVLAQEYVAKRVLIKILNWMGIRNDIDRNFLRRFFDPKLMSDDYIRKHHETIDRYIVKKKELIHEVEAWATLFRKNARNYQGPKGEPLDLMVNAALFLEGALNGYFVDREYLLEENSRK